MVTLRGQGQISSHYKAQVAEEHLAYMHCPTTYRSVHTQLEAAYTKKVAHKNNSPRSLAVNPGPVGRSWTLSTLTPEVRCRQQKTVHIGNLLHIQHNPAPYYGSTTGGQPPPECVVVSLHGTCGCTCTRGPCVKQSTTVEPSAAIVCDEQLNSKAQGMGNARNVAIQSTGVQSPTCPESNS